MIIHSNLVLNFPSLENFPLPKVTQIQIFLLYKNTHKNKSIRIQMTVISQTAAGRCVSVFQGQGREDRS